MKPDEQSLLLALHRQPQPYARDIVAELGIHPKRAAYILGKWTRLRWYDYGVSVLAGWLTDAGHAEATKIPLCRVCGKPAEVAVPCKAINLAPIGKAPPQERFEFFCQEHFPR